jgi:hypothetical protein
MPARYIGDPLASLHFSYELFPEVSIPPHVASLALRLVGRQASIPVRLQMDAPRAREINATASTD